MMGNFSNNAPGECNAFKGVNRKNISSMAMTVHNNQEPIRWYNYIDNAVRI